MHKQAKPGRLPMHPASRPKALVLVVIATWLAAIVVPPAVLSVWRANRLVELSTPGVQAEWDAFREAMRKESGRDGPVQRKVPKSAEPPELVWLRDYFLLAVVAWVTLVGVLGGFVGMLVVGVSADRRDAPTSRGSARPSAPPQKTTPP
jgi:hypothetical protein